MHVMFILLLACNGDSPGPIGNIRNQDECTDDDLQLFYEDLDGDGFGGAELWACEKPADAVQNPDDCNDLNGGVHPDAEELCSTARDDNCDGETNDGLDGETFFLDQDQDGFGDEPTVSCRWPDGYATLEGDCDDQDPEINPRADEVCNDLDDDCDEEVDEFVGGFYYTDEDGDGWGTGQGESMCDPPDEVAEKGGDCDDSDTGLTESGFYYEGTLQEIENGATWTFPDDGTLQICGGTWNVRIAATDVSASIVGVDAGEEVMLSGGKTSVPISVSGGSVTMTGLTLVDGVGEQGGCVSSVDAELFVQYIKARDCSATDGAGFFVRGGSLTVIDSSLRNNKADNLGGSFYVQDGDLVLDNVIVSRSEAAMGGGLYVGTGATAEVSRGEFHD